MGVGPYYIKSLKNMEHEPPVLQELDRNAPGQRDARSRRTLQQVSTVAIRKDVVAWMIEEEVVHGKNNLMACTVDAFLDVFRSTIRNSNLVKAARWWKSQDDLFPDEDENTCPELTVTRAQYGRHRHFKSKCAKGRGPKKAAWVT